MRVLIFSGVTKIQKIEFIPGVAYGLDCPRAAEVCVEKMGWAVDAPEGTEPQVSYTADRTAVAFGIIDGPSGELLFEDETPA